MERQDTKGPERHVVASDDTLEAGEGTTLERVLAAAPPGSRITFVTVRLPQSSECTLPEHQERDGRMKQWLTPKEVAEKLSVRPATVRTWANAGRFPGMRRLKNGAIRIPASEVTDALQHDSAGEASKPPGTGEASFDENALSGWRNHVQSGHR
jgi:predicted DNA-binding transcriptional regulator AlpA